MKDKTVLENLKNTIDYIKNEIYKLDNFDNISLIERDIILDKVKYLYELVYSLEVKLNNNLNVLSVDEVKDESETILLNNNTDDNLKENLEPFVPQVEMGLKNELEKEKIEDKKADNNKIIDKKETILETNKVSLNEKLKIINEKETVADKINKQLVKDLKKAIGINEKFSFINNLFKGNQEAYQLAIDFLNSLDSYSDAENYINTMSLKYNWDKNSDVYNEFMSLVSRKFGV